MTVCVAAICDGNSVIGAADRMLTAGTIEFEPEQSKILQLTNAITLMIAGDSTVQAEVASGVLDDVNARIKKEPANWWKVPDVANLCAIHLERVPKRQRHAVVLAPLGLDPESFIARQRELLPEFTAEVARSLQSFQPSGGNIETIVAGVDYDGPHIFVVKESSIQCFDMVGFAAIGSGASHANSQLMFRGHSRVRPGPETLFLVYWAKKRAEVAPFVGSSTDMFIVGPQLASFKRITESVLDMLEDTFKSVDRATADLILGAESSILGKIAEMQEKRESQQATEKSPLPTDPPAETTPVR